MLKKLGFTMIELLVVIAVIGILAVALLSTLNPLEQIRKGRDTRTRSDMSQLVGGIERYNASLGYFPWQASEGQNLVANTADIPFLQIGGAGGPDNITGSSPALTVATALDNLTSTSEVKASFIDRITSATYTETYLFFDDETTGGSVVACFTPESQSFSKEAFDRCKAGASSWSTDFLPEVYGTNAGATVFPCGDGTEANYAAPGTLFLATDADEMICLP